MNNIPASGSASIGGPRKTRHDGKNEQMNEEISLDAGSEIVESSEQIVEESAELVASGWTSWSLQAVSPA
ncbi:uncharacterized protein LOC122534840 isoform X2 [Frieseomelitta varia]|uniref:uncharacterized protein LOC122534840 isoform X2 n=1 Tax=Frieseomelitta varia TaxID=561572 RepID=UPI001CB6AD49|nr:uncharacterized protein LOC122534840 isoform X2 [Frieseomelitta varia]